MHEPGPVTEKPQVHPVAHYTDGAITLVPGNQVRGHALDAGIAPGKLSLSDDAREGPVHERAPREIAGVVPHEVKTSGAPVRHEIEQDQEEKTPGCRRANLSSESAWRATRILATRIDRHRPTGHVGSIGISQPPAQEIPGAHA